MFETISSQVILHVFTSKKKRPKLIIKRKECEKTQNSNTLYMYSLTVIFFFCIFLDHCSFRTPGYGNTPGIPRAYSKLPSLRTGRVSNFAAIFFFYIFNRLENDFVVLYSKLIRKAFILKPKIITHLMHDNLKPILIFGFEKILPVLTNLKKPDSFQGWRFQKSFLAMTP